MDTSILKRYTNLASLVSILTKKELTLLDPAKWEDKNDSHYLRKYGAREGYKSLFALCFTTAAETSHHWKSFCPGSDGVCIKLDTDKFRAYLDTLEAVVHGPVFYKLIDQVESDQISVNELPFLKRYPFRDEAEYRVLYQTAKPSKLKSHAIPFDLSLVREITLSNSLPRELRGPLVDLLASIPGCKNIKFSRSNLNDNERWKRASDRAA